ncbi:PepSY-associated TM helix domain-containing protein [Lysobacter sp. GX 14042]|uniref:PepSY-associated TM helix domain-containing protein n=1 Tax=Lysobacter sp. GX 14042 TaxID=2907155 RepID=UPI001F21C09E|nr:PepSY-associated TM helix domain-containing protein [Lysobacter sp. GX 14042]MCE7031837.1 PepSY-associated TM helix domain-containing protein [Lysobacter sp. GX 14042]
MAATPHASTAMAASRRSWWLKTLHRWHWISAAVSLAGLLVFAATGITLNHAAQIESTARVSVTTGTLPAELSAGLAGVPADAPLPVPVARWLADTHGIRAGGRAGEWDELEVYVSLPRAGGDAWLAIDRETGDFEYERTDRGTVAWLNDLHKGRNTGAAWRWFIDLLAVACVLFALTGLWLLWLHARQRTSTWPLVATGVVVPVLLILLFMH